ncbi:conserved hypothetical protein [Ricinus communis]|uniref:SOSEKI DIX-like domain-containing protein n=1 Tax=Ricinus communis TaxID=3988 RepID=B9T164_RICCO|nr:conserved hypothetical protein [Ricinus communis]
MATNSTEEIGGFTSMKYQDKETNDGKAKMQIQLKPEPEKKVAVVYYLSRNGQLEHPHFVDVSLSSSQGLYLRDVMNTLKILRGQGMASMYSWASKRSYKNAFLWQDLSDDDIIYPCHGQDYVLKGSLLLETSLSFRSNDSISSSSNSRRSSEMNNSSSEAEDSNSPLIRSKSNSWSSIDEHTVYKAETARINGYNVSTQTEDNRRVKMEIEETKPEGLGTIKLKQKEFSAPTSKSIEVYRSDSSNNRYQKAGGYNPSARTNDSKVLMKLIRCGCGSKRFKDFEMMENRY